MSDTRGWIIFIHHLCVTVLDSLPLSVQLPRRLLSKRSPILPD
nr:MAG TPA: hypothetical protein [Caudoviricetes sp.]DAL44788.1 MAG TPA_asm: hypothetical protein [Caudoviricetes sp.]